MVRAYFETFSTYGFWLPNDPRGSRSKEVRAANIAPFGPATRVETRRSVAHQPHDVQVRREPKAALQFPEVTFTREQVGAVARGFARAVDESGYIVHACAILPQHVHLVVARTSDRTIERIVGHLKARATQQLQAEDLHPLAAFRQRDGSIPTPWSQRRGWSVYLNSNEAIVEKIAYTEENPVKEGKPRQQWSFVRPFEC